MIKVMQSMQQPKKVIQRIIGFEENKKRQSLSELMKYEEYEEE